MNVGRSPYLNIIKDKFSIQATFYLLLGESCKLKLKPFALSLVYLNLFKTDSYMKQRTCKKKMECLLSLIKMILKHCFLISAF